MGKIFHFLKLAMLSAMKSDRFHLQKHGTKFFWIEEMTAPALTRHQFLVNLNEFKTGFDFLANFWALDDGPQNLVWVNQKKSLKERIEC